MLRLASVLPAVSPGEPSNSPRNGDTCQTVAVSQVDSNYCPRPTIPPRGYMGFLRSGEDGASPDAVALTIPPLGYVALSDSNRSLRRWPTLPL